MNEKEREALDKNTREISYLRDDFQKFFSIAKTLLPEIAETKTLQRLINEREECRKRNNLV